MASTQAVPAGGQAVAAEGQAVAAGGQANAAGVQPVQAGARRVGATRQPPPAGGAAREIVDGQAQSADAAGASTGQALVPVPLLLGEEESDPGFGPLVARLPVELDVAVPVRGFRVRHLLALAPGELIASQWSHGIDLPLAAGAVRLAWSEFEVLDTKMAVRVTRLA